MSDYAIKVEHLSKEYTIGKARSGSIYETFGKLFSVGKKKEADSFWALDDINFEIKHGQAVGIVGRNGAGKSTLLKVLSRITQPTKGRFTINGRVSSLLEVGTGFHPELSGKENIFLNGTILGMSRREVRSKLDEIVEFSGVEKFLDTAVKHYSSGMYVRLAFAVAAHLEPEILIIDEVLAVGDASFQKKCLGKMEQVTGEGRTVLFVSHNMDAVKSLCTSGILLRNGKKILHTTDVGNVISQYLNEARSDSDNSSELLDPSGEVFKNEYHNVKHFCLKDDDDNIIQNTTTSTTNLQVELAIDTFDRQKHFNLGYIIYNQFQQAIFWTWLYEENTIHESDFAKGSYKFTTHIPSKLLPPGQYQIELVSVIHGVKSLFANNNGPSLYFTIEGGNISVLLTPKLEWKLENMN